MLWHEITIYTTEEATEMISSFFHELGAGGVSIEESGTLDKNGIRRTGYCTTNRSMISRKAVRK